MVAVHAWAWGSVLVTAAVLAAVLGLVLRVAWPVEVLPVLVLAARAVALAGAAVAVAAVPALGIAVALDELAPPGRGVRASQRVLSASRDVPPLALGVVALGVGAVGGLPYALAVLAVYALPLLAQGARGALGRARAADRLAAVALGASRIQVFVRVVWPSAVPALAGVAVRTVARLVAAAAPLLLVDPALGSLAGAVFRDAVTGRVAEAAAGALVLTALVIGLDAVAGALDRRIRWKERA